MGWKRLCEEKWGSRERGRKGGRGGEGVSVPILASITQCSHVPGQLWVACQSRGAIKGLRFVCPQWRQRDRKPANKAINPGHKDINRASDQLGGDGRHIEANRTIKSTRRLLDFH